MDLTLAYKILASRTHDYGATAWKAMLWLWGYLKKETYPMLILRRGHGEPKLSLYVDATWNSCKETRRPMVSLAIL